MAKDKLTLRLTVEVTYDLNGTDPEELEHMLGHIPTHYAGHGAFTEDTPAEVETWSSSLVEVLDEVECDTCQRLARDKAAGDPCEHCSGEMVELVDAGVTVHEEVTSTQDDVSIPPVPQLVTPVAGPDAGKVFAVGDECPQCKCGTLEASDGEIRCMGECGCVQPAQRLPSYASLNGNECDDKGCPGWGVFYRDDRGTFEIERCDNCKRFESDDEALAYVYLLESDDVARHLRHYGQPYHEWLKDNIQMPRLLAELYAHMEVSEDTETMQEPGYLSVKILDLCASMDLSWARVLEIFKRADLLFEEDKRTTLEEPHVRTED